MVVPAIGRARWTALGPGWWTRLACAREWWGTGGLPQTARAMSYAVRQGTSREARATAQEFGRLPYERASFERVAHVVGAMAVADHQDIEDALIDAVEVPEEASSVSVSLDRVRVPMEETAPATGRAAQKGCGQEAGGTQFPYGLLRHGDAA
jgi:hypothetical protein